MAAPYDIGEVSRHNGVKWFYDDASGTPVEITKFVINSPTWSSGNYQFKTTPPGSDADVYIDTGRAKSHVLELKFLFQGGSANTPDTLFVQSNNPASNTRTLTCELYQAVAGDPGIAKRDRQVETILEEYTSTTNANDGLTEATAKLRFVSRTTEGGVYTPE